MPNKKLLAYRNYAGIGDWIMALTVLKMVNIQYPDIDIYLNMTARNLHLRQRNRHLLPELTREIINCCDVKIKKLVYHRHSNESYNSDYDYISGHMVYDKADNKLFIESMVDRFNRRTALNVKYDPSIYMQCSGVVDSKQIHRKPYILMQSCTKRRHEGPQWKDYGYRNMCAIAMQLHRHVDIVQIGGAEDLVLPVRTKYLGANLSTLHNLMINSLGFVGMDGMLGIYAAHNNVRQYIVYTGNFNMNWTNFPNRLQLNGNENDNQAISQLIINDLGVNKTGNQIAA